MRMPIYLRGAVLFSAGLLLCAHTRAGGSWTPSNIPGTNNWSAVAASADGLKLAAAAYDDPQFNPGSIYTSTNGGLNWTKTSAPSHYWYSITSSTNGDKLAATVSGGGIYTSDDSGSTWLPATNAPSAAWYAIAASYDGTHLVAVAGGSDRSIYTSPDAGNTWISNNVPTSEYWYAVASSADGRNLAAVSNSNTNSGPGAIYVSTNSGQAWTRCSLNGVNWSGIGSSGDGQDLVACGSSSMIYTSHDGGLNWKHIQNVTGFFTGAASSADGQRFAVVANSGQIYTSIDSGFNWVSNNVQELDWQEVASSRDGNLIIAAAPGDQIYALRSPPTLDQRNSSNTSLLSWSWPSPGFVVEHILDLSKSNWQQWGTSPIFTNWKYQVVAVRTNQQEFFRLKLP